MSGPVAACQPVEAPLGIAARLNDYIRLTKPRIAVLELITVCVGAAAAASLAPTAWLPDLGQLAWALLGTLLVAGSASTINQVLERTSDGLMSRTQNRPLPAGRLTMLEAMVFGTVTGVLGVAVLSVFVNPATTILGVVSWLLYVAVYTPMKPRSSFNTVVGAIPGGLPIVMGWTAVGGPLSIEALVLFGIVFLWQFPHFMAIAWLCRDDYRAAGLKMISVDDPTGYGTGLLAVLTSVKLLAVSLVPVLLGLSGWWYAAAAVILGGILLVDSWRLWRTPNDTTARRLLRTSLLYLPLVLLALVLNLTPS